MISTIIILFASRIGGICLIFMRQFVYTLYLFIFLGFVEKVNHFICSTLLASRPFLIRVHANSNKKYQNHSGNTANLHILVARSPSVNCAVIALLESDCLLLNIPNLQIIVAIGVWYTQYSEYILRNVSLACFLIEL